MPTPAPTPLPAAFYARDTATVARELLGCRIIRRWRQELLIGRIVETEAYYGPGDPASRAASGKRNKLNGPMWEAPGTILVYMVHSNWLFNITTERDGVPAAVLIRAVEPQAGLKYMLRARQRRNPTIASPRELTSGPGKFTQAFYLNQKLNYATVTNRASIWVAAGDGDKLDIAASHRIGVTRDVTRQLRFYLRRNPFVSKGKP